MRLIDADKLGLTDFEILLCNGDYKEALKMLLQKIEDAETIEQPKEKDESKKTTPNDSCKNSAKIESSIKPGDINNDLDLKIREAEADAYAAELLSKSNDPFYRFGSINWNEKAKEKRQLAEWLKELKQYKEKENPATWVYDETSDTMRCSKCGGNCEYDKRGSIETPFCPWCGEKMKMSWTCVES